MNYFIKRLLLFIVFGFIQLIIILIGYMYTDPFKVLKSYSNFSYPKVQINRDYISTEMFLKNYKKQKYNSFIFGSSRTMAFKPLHWKKFLNNEAKPFMFDASSENIYGIYSKIKFIDSLNVPIKNALIILCRDVSFPGTFNFEGHLFIKNYKVTSTNKFKFHFIFFKAYCDPKFLISWYTYIFTNKYMDWMKGTIFNGKSYFDPVTNEMRILDQDLLLKNNPNKYYDELGDIFYERKKTIDNIPKISTKDAYYLQIIKNIFVKNKTNYRIIISPLYEQIKLNRTDYLILKKKFDNQLFDFSGKSNLTESKYNFFEISHYRPHIGDSILFKIYKN